LRGKTKGFNCDRKQYSCRLSLLSRKSEDNLKRISQSSALRSKKSIYRGKSKGGTENEGGFFIAGERVIVRDWSNNTPAATADKGGSTDSVGCREAVGHGGGKNKRSCSERIREEGCRECRSSGGADWLGSDREKKGNVRR